MSHEHPEAFPRHTPDDRGAPMSAEPAMICVHTRAENVRPRDVLHGRTVSTVSTTLGAPAGSRVTIWTTEGARPFDFAAGAYVDVWRHPEPDPVETLAEQVAALLSRVTELEAVVGLGRSAEPEAVKPDPNAIGPWVDGEGSEQVRFFVGRPTEHGRHLIAAMDSHRGGTLVWSDVQGHEHFLHVDSRAEADLILARLYPQVKP